MKDEPSLENDRRRFYIVATTIVVAGALLRLFHIEARSLWLDEFTSIQIASLSLSNIVGGIGFDQHTPPFYYVLLHFWLQLWGTGEWGLRSFSLLTDILSTALIISIFSRQFSKKIGLVCGSVYGLSAFAIYYAQEGRMYALLILLVLVTYRYALSARTKTLTAPKVIALLLTAIAGMYTHYYFTFVLCGLSLGLLIEHRKRFRDFLPWFSIMLLVLVAYIPWVTVVVGLAQSGGQSFRRFTFETLPYTFFRFSAGYGNMPLELGMKENIVQTLSNHSALIIVYGLVFGLVLYHGVRTLQLQHRAELTLVSCTFLIPFLLATLISIKIPMLSERYLTSVYPFFVLLVVLGLGGRLAVIKQPLVFGLLVFALLQHFANPRFGNTNWREALSSITVLGGTQQTIIVNPNYAMGVASYYAPEGSSVRDKIIETDNDFWLIERGTAASRVSEFLESYRVDYTQEYRQENGLSLHHFVKR